MRFEWKTTLQHFISAYLQCRVTMEASYTWNITPGALQVIYTAQSMEVMDEEKYSLSSGSTLVSGSSTTWCSTQLVPPLFTTTTQGPASLPAVKFPAVIATAQLDLDTSSLCKPRFSIIQPSKFNHFSFDNFHSNSRSSIIQPSRFHGTTSQTCSLSHSSVLSDSHRSKPPNNSSVPCPFDDTPVESIISTEDQINAFTFIGTSKNENVGPSVCRKNENYRKGFYKRKRRYCFWQKGLRRQRYHKRQKPVFVSTFSTSTSSTDQKDAKVLEGNGGVDSTFL
ncbi:uncharacterized protein [Macrobrachium rosenbergii]|uniref:uncharacterized protein n=1 Tax=Macrobrachium rosenbergii TaxID=79674 RepID=UPI0034D7BB39